MLRESTRCCLMTAVCLLKLTCGIIIWNIQYSLHVKNTGDLAINCTLVSLKNNFFGRVSLRPAFYFATIVINNYSKRFL